MIKSGLRAIGSILKDSKAVEKRIKIAGDHSGYHCGSFAVYSVISDAVRKNGVLVDEGDDYDVLVVNGEGSMHHDSASMKKKMKIIEGAVSEGKDVHLVNTVWQDNSNEYADILKLCSSVVAREKMSRVELKRQGVESTIQYDASYFYGIDENSDYTDFEGGVVFTDFWSKEFNGFVILNSKWPKKFPMVDMTSVSWSYLVKSLRTASLLVTGRHHAVYAACKAETPFLAMPGNTHKIEGIFSTAGVPAIPVKDSFSDIKRIVEKEDYSECFESCESLFSEMRKSLSWELKV